MLGGAVGISGLHLEGLGVSANRHAGNSRFDIPLPILVCSFIITVYKAVES